MTILEEVEKLNSGKTDTNVHNVLELLRSQGTINEITCQGDSTLVQYKGSPTDFSPIIAELQKNNIFIHGFKYVKNMDYTNVWLNVI